MTTTEFVIYVFGTGVGGAILGKSYDKWLNNKKDTLEIELKEQVFYKTLIKDITTQREIEQAELIELKNKVQELTLEVRELVKRNKEQAETIEHQRGTIKRWEENSVKLEKIVKTKDIQITKLFKEIEEHENNG